MDTLKVMKQEDLQPRLLYPARISFRFEWEIKNLQIGKFKRIQHHQTSSTKNTKGASLDKEHKKERHTKQIPKNKINHNKIIHIDNYLKCK